MKVKPVIKTGLAGRPRGIIKKKRNIKPCYVYAIRNKQTNVSTLVGYEEIVHNYTCSRSTTSREPISKKHKRFYRIRRKTEVYACTGCRLSFLTKNLKSKDLRLYFDILAVLLSLFWFF
jgi:hypothetical protein